MASWQVHRFGDCVAISTGHNNGETIYLESHIARQMAAGIQRACRSIEREPFSASGDNTRSGAAVCRTDSDFAGVPRLARDSEGRACGYIRDAS